MRWPPRLWLLGPLRETRARRCANGLCRRRLERPCRDDAPSGPQSGWFLLLHRLSVETAAGERCLPRRAAAGGGPPALTDVHRVHRGVQYFMYPIGLRSGNRDYPHPAGGDAGLHALSAGDRRGRPFARADRFLQLRRSVPPQTGDRDVRIHQESLSAHLPVHEHQWLGLHRGPGAPPGALRDRRGDFFHRRRDSGELRPIPATRATRCRARQSAFNG